MKNFFTKLISDFNIMTLALLLCILCFFGIDYLRQSTAFQSVYMFLNLMYWISLGTSMVCVYFVIKSSKLENVYNEGGNLYHWYDIKLNERGTLWLIRVFEELLKIDLLSQDKLVIVSPSANKGIYEKELFKFLCTKDINTKFIVTDINIIDNHEESIKEKSSEYVFLNESNDAKEIDNILKKVNEVNTDVILDFEGCLWYIKEFNWYKKEKCVSEVMEVLRRYNAVLNDDGMILVDNTKTRTIEVIIRQFSNLFSHFNLNLPEHSTGWYLQEIYKNKKYSYYKNFIDELFYIQTIDVINDKNKVMSVLCLKKK